MDPITRQEMFLSAAAGEGTEMPDPITREEVYLKKIAESGGGGGGTTNYNSLSNKPSINGVELSGDKTSSDLHIEGGESVTTEDITAAISVGGIASGTTYEAGTSLEDILKDMLEPTLYPSFTAPSASLTYNASTYYAVGSNIAALTATLAFNRGAINPAYGTDGKRAGAATGYSIATTGADTEYTDTSESSGSFSVPALTRGTKGTIKITGTVSYAEGAQPKDSKGNNYESPLPAGSVTASKTVTFIQPYYYGASDTATVSDFTGLTQSVTTKGQKTFNFTTNNQYMVFAYDSSYGNLTSILDSNGFETISGWNKSTVTVDGLSYFVYVSDSPITDTNAAFTFKY